MFCPAESNLNWLHPNKSELPKKQAHTVSRLLGFAKLADCGYNGIAGRKIGEIKWHRRVYKGRNSCSLFSQ